MRKKLVKKLLSIMVSAIILITMCIPAFAVPKDIGKDEGKEQIIRWMKFGIVNGYSDNTFKPTKNISKIEFVTILSRVFKYVDEVQNTFKDVPKNKAYSHAINKLIAANILDNGMGRFYPNAYFTKEQAAVMLQKAFSIETKDVNSYAKLLDNDQISEGSRSAIGGLLENGVIAGKGTKFFPKMYITRSEAIMMLDKLVKDIKQKAGTYEGVVKGNLVVNTPDVILKNMSIEGDLYLAQGIGEGNVTLEGVVVNGRTIVQGAGMNSVTVKDSKLVGTLYVNKSNGKVRILAEGSSDVAGVKMGSGGKLEENISTGNGFGSLEILPSAKNVKIFLKGSFDKVLLNAEKATVELSDDTNIETLTLNTESEIKGSKAQIKNANVTSDNVKIEATPENYEIADGKSVYIAGKKEEGSFKKPDPVMPQPEKTKLDLVQNGQTEFKIVRKENASPSVIFAAEEMQTYIEKITGVKIPIVYDSEPLTAYEIIVGNNSHLEAIGQSIDWADLGEEGYTIKTISHRYLVIAGSEARGALYGVYTFLEKQLGCMWLTETVNKIPTKSDISIEKLNYTEKPAFMMRDAMSADLKNPDFLAKMKLNSHSMTANQEEYWDGSAVVKAQPVLTQKYGGEQGPWARPMWHTSFFLIDPAVNLSTHPDWYAMDANGNRNATQLCWSNAEVQAELKKNVLAWMERNPDSRWFHISQQDGGGYCLCDLCKANAEKYKNSWGINSQVANILLAINAIAPDIKAAYPDNKLVTFAYAWTEDIPLWNDADATKNFPKLEDNIWIQHCMFNAWDMTYYKEWSTFAEGRIIEWDYQGRLGSSSGYLPHPNYYLLANSLKSFSKEGLKGIMTQGLSYEKCGEFLELKSYILAKLMWDPNLDVDTLMDEFGNAYYGAAWPSLRSYIHLTADEFKNLNYDNFYGDYTGTNGLQAEYLAKGSAMNQAYKRIFEKNWCRFTYLDPVTSGFVDKTYDALYCDPEKMTTYMELFNQAKAAVGNDATLLKRVKTANMGLQNVILEGVRLDIRNDANGNPIYLKDADGNIVKDENGNDKLLYENEYNVLKQNYADAYYNFFTTALVNGNWFYSEIYPNGAGIWGYPIYVYENGAGTLGAELLPKPETFEWETIAVATTSAGISCEIIPDATTNLVTAAVTTGAGLGFTDDGDSFTFYGYKKTDSAYYMETGIDAQVDADGNPIGISGMNKGVMFRSSMDPKSAFLAASLSYTDNTLKISYRNEQDGTVGTLDTSAIPPFSGIVHIGVGWDTNNYYVYYYNETDWTCYYLYLPQGVVINLGNNDYYVGTYLTSGSTDTLVNTTFSAIYQAVY